jgi:hypothetical protein
VIPILRNLLINHFDYYRILIVIIVDYYGMFVWYIIYNIIYHYSGMIMGLLR